MEDNSNKEPQPESTNTEIQNKENIDQDDAQGESKTAIDDNKEDQIQQSNDTNDTNAKNESNDQANENEANNREYAESQIVDIKHDSKEPTSENKDGNQEYAETQIADTGREINDILTMASSQPNIEDPRGLTGHKKRFHRKIEPIKLQDIPTWTDFAQKFYKGKRLPKQKDLIFQPNDSINDLISYMPRGDSTVLEVDAIVNAANSGLYAGGGICGAIHSAAGPELEEACMKFGGCETGNAVITPGFNLPAKNVIHAVGPVGQHPEALKSAYEKTLALIDGKDIRSVALCCLSTGIYGYPIRPATKIALRTVREFLENDENRKKVDRIIFVVFLQKDCTVYENMLPYYFPLPKGAIVGAEEEEDYPEEKDEEEDEEEEDYEIKIDDYDSSEIEKYKTVNIDPLLAENQEAEYIINENEESEAKNEESEAKNEESEAKNQESEAKNEESEAKNQESEAKNQESEAKNEESEAKNEESEAKNEESEAKNENNEENKNENNEGNNGENKNEEGSVKNEKDQNE